MLCLTTFAIKSQELSTAGQSYLKFYKKNIEKLKKMDPGAMGYENEVSQAEKQIKSIKKTDPNYDVSELTSEIDEYKEKVKNADNAAAENEKANEDLDDELENFLSERLTNASTKEDVTNNEKEVSKFQQNFNSYLQNKLLSSSESKYALPKIERHIKNDNEDNILVSSYKENIAKVVDPLQAENRYNQINLINSKRSLLSKAFPQSSILKDAVKESEAALQTAGGKTEIIKIATANKYEITKKVRMQPAVAKDPELENQIKSGLQSIYVGKGKTIIATHILSPEWQINRNSITGVILGRCKKFQVAFKEADGNCRLFSDLIQQDYNGSGYGKGYIVNGNYTGGYEDILCENVNK